MASMVVEGGKYQYTALVWGYMSSPPVLLFQAGMNILYNFMMTSMGMMVVQWRFTMAEGNIDSEDKRMLVSMIPRIVNQQKLVDYHKD